MRKAIIFACMMLVSAASMAQPTVYFTKEITPESLIKIYEKL